MTDLAGALLFHLARTLSWLPWAAVRRLADALAWSWRRNDARTARVVRRNLELALPELPQAPRAQLEADILRVTAGQALETLRIWTRPAARNLAAIVQTSGVELFDAALAAGRGVIVAAPHYGNWELLNQWLASRTPLAILYAPPDSPVVEAFLRRVRGAQGDAGRVEQVRAEGPAIRGLFKRLQGGGVVGILPDQQPKAGDGEFAPFFGLPALTMTLLPRLAQRTGATVLLGYCERLRDTPAGPVFALRFEPAPEAAHDVAGLNVAVERVARRDLLQYQWTYKRWSIPPPGSSRGNPYWPDCYPRHAQRTATRAHEDAPP